MHELSNLLDGSMRNLGLAIRSLDHDQSANSQDNADQPATPHHSADQTADAILTRIQTADAALRQMAALLGQWVNTPTSQQASLDWIAAAPSLAPAAQGEDDSLAAAVSLLTNLYQDQCDQLGIQLHTHLDPHAGKLPVGPLLPVMQNLIKNSIEAIRDQPNTHPHTIELHLALAGHELHIDIKDSGGGINHAVMTPTGDLKPGQSTKQDGNGIGLPLTRDIVASLQGNLDVHSNELGTHFHIVIPAAALRN